MSVSKRLGNDDSSGFAFAKEMLAGDVTVTEFKGIQMVNISSLSICYVKKVKLLLLILVIQEDIGIKINESLLVYVKLLMILMLLFIWLTMQKRVQRTRTKFFLWKCLTGMKKV